MMNLRIAHRVRWKTLAALATLWLAACGGEGGGATGPSAPATPEGNYTLSTIDTRALPFMMYSDTGFTLEVTAGSIAVTANGRWVSRITSRETVAGFVSTYVDSTFGTWTAAGGSAAMLNTETQVTSTATWTANDITVTEVDGAVSRKVVYRRN